NLGIWFPLVRHVFFSKDGLDRALGLTGTAIDALVRFDVQHPVFAFLKMDAIHGADIHACLVHNVHARFSYHVGHSCILHLCKGQQLPPASLAGGIAVRSTVLSGPVIRPHKDTLTTSHLASTGFYRSGYACLRVVSNSASLSCCCVPVA